MKKFLRYVFIFSLPIILLFIVLAGLYVYYDPFKVLRKYSDYSNARLVPNRDYISTEVFTNNYKTIHYNSFIFGSSRSLAFKANTWKQYLDSTDQPYTYDASVESIYGIYKKFVYLDKLNVPIKNALIIFCHDATFIRTKNSEGYLYIKHPSISGESKIAFQMEYLKTYFTWDFLYNFYCYKLKGHYEPWMHKVIQNSNITFDSITNQATFVDVENELVENPVKFYEKKRGIFYLRTGEFIDTVQQIQAKQLFMLQEIKKILEKNKTNYKIIISPLYEQIKYSPADFNILKGLFGSNLYNFSGKNYFTDSATHYYEASHYRKEIADSILRIIYKK